MKGCDRKIMVICDYNEAYVSRLADYLSGKEEFPYAVWFFTREQDLLEFLKEREVKLLLIGEAFYRGIEDRVHVDDLFLLTDRESSKGDTRRIYRYQSAQKILFQLLKNGETEVKIPIRSGQGGVARVYGFQSYLQPELRGVMALCMAQRLARKQSTLFVNLEGMNSILPGDCFRDWNLTDLFYIYRNDRGRFLNKLVATTQKLSELQYLPPVRSPRDLEGIVDGEWWEFLAAIRDSGVFEVIVLNLAENIPDKTKVSDLCDRLFEVKLQGSENPYYAYWEQKLEDYLGREEPPRESILVEETLWKEAREGFYRQAIGLDYGPLGRICTQYLKG